MQKAWRIVEAALCFGGILVVTARPGARPAAPPPPVSTSAPPRVFIQAAAGRSVTKSGDPTSPHTPLNRGGSASSPPSPHQAALAQAQELLAALAPYPGAVPLTPAPYINAASAGEKGVLLPPSVAGAPEEPAMGTPGTPDLVDLYRVWRVPASASVVQSWVASRLTAAAYSRSGTSASIDHGATTSLGSAWTAPGGNSDAELEVATAIIGSASALVRYDAVVQYLPAHPASEKLPPGPISVRIRTTGWPGLQGAAAGPVTVIGAATIDALVAAFNALPVAPQGAFSCPAELSGGQWHLTLDFVYPTRTLQVTERPSCAWYGVSLDSNGGALQLSDADRTLLNLAAPVLGLRRVSAGTAIWAVPPVS